MSMFYDFQKVYSLKYQKKTNPLGGTQLQSSENLTLLQVKYNKIELTFKDRHKQKVPKQKIRFN